MIIFTNDGEFAAKLSHPSSQIEKEYIVFYLIIKNNLLSILKYDSLMNIVYTLRCKS